MQLSDDGDEEEEGEERRRKRSRKDMVDEGGVVEMLVSNRT